MSLTVTTSVIPTKINGYDVYQFTRGSSTVTFTGSGNIDLLVVGGGGSTYYSKELVNKKTNTTYDSGGAGGFIEILNYPVSSGDYNIVVGKGGTCTTTVCNTAAGGTTSYFVGTGGGIGAGGGGGSKGDGKNYNTGTSSITHGCGGSGSYFYLQNLVFTSGNTTVYNAGSSNISGISGTTIGSNNGQNTATYTGAGGAGTNGDGKLSDIIGQTCSAAKDNSQGSYGSNGNNSNSATGQTSWYGNGKDGIVAFRIKPPPTLAPTTMSPTTVRPTTMSPTTVHPTTMSPTTAHPTTPASTTSIPTTPGSTTSIPTTPGSTTMSPTTVHPTTPGSTTMAPTTPFPTILYNTPPVVPQLESLLKLDENLQTQLSNKMDQDNQNFQQARLIDLNDSYRKRYLEYIKLVMVAVLACFFLWFFNVLNQYEYLPSGIVDLFIIITVSLCVVYIYVVWTNIQARDLLNYDEIDYAPPDTSKNKTNEQTVNVISPTPTTYNGTSLVSTQGCSNPVCPSGYKYSQQTKMCELDVNLDINKIGSLILGEIQGYL
jgi:hypothetical protein